jgi:glycosyltransferase involved in cell wall biosynthesis
VNNAFYIIPVYNKEERILDVLNGIKKSHSNKTKPNIICVLDACTDNSENIVKEFKYNSEYSENIHIIYENDVHEIRCINAGLKYIKDNLNPQPEDMIFGVQDDVILDEEDIDLKMNNLFQSNPNLGYIAMRIGLSLHSSGGEIRETDLLESEFGAWDQLGWSVHKSIPHMTFVPVQIAVRSPHCILWKRLDEAGFFDEKLEPAGYDCHDMSIRMNKLGYQNGLYALKYISDVNWGTMRKPESWTPRMEAIYLRNRIYLADKHSDYFL